MNKERLLILSNHLKTVNPETFSMLSWKSVTAACAIGHACSIVEFQRQGLSFQGLHLVCCSSVGEVVGWDAACEFFGLSRKDAEYLFMHDSYAGEVTAIDVSDRILDFIK